MISMLCIYIHIAYTKIRRTGTGTGHPYYRKPMIQFTVQMPYSAFQYQRLRSISDPPGALQIFL